MHVWSGNPGIAARPNDDTVGSESEAVSPQSSAAPSTNWRAFVAVAVVALLGWPFISTGTIHAAWAEISRFLSFRWKS